MGAGPHGVGEGGAPRELDGAAESLRSSLRHEVGPRRSVLDTHEGDGPSASGMGVGPHAVSEAGAPRAALRRCRHAVPARVAVGPTSHPQHVAVHRRGFTGGAVIGCAGPWRTSGCWWESAGSSSRYWNRDEWDVALSDGTVYRLFRDCSTDTW